MKTDQKTLDDRNKLAEAFDRLYQEGDPRNYVIPPHQERSAAFDWFIKGALYERQKHKDLASPNDAE